MLVSVHVCPSQSLHLDPTPPTPAPPTPSPTLRSSSPLSCCPPYPLGKRPLYPTAFVVYICIKYSAIWCITEIQLLHYFSNIPISRLPSFYFNPWVDLKFYFPKISPKTLLEFFFLHKQVYVLNICTADCTLCITGIQHIRHGQFFILLFLLFNASSSSHRKRQSRLFLEM